jgi:outer membrane protein TolC
MKTLIKSFIFFISIAGFAQQELALQECYSLVSKNYPFAQQTALLEKQNDIDISVIETERLPKLDFSAQATYQSDVTGIPIATIEPLNKDQYRAMFSVNQLIYGGGMIDASTHAKSLSLESSKKQVEVNLYQIKKQVNQLYFSVLLVQENKLLLMARKSQLEDKLKEIKSGIKYGTLLPASDKVIEVELLKIQQNTAEIDLTKKSLLETLSSLIGQPIHTETTLLKQDFFINNTNEISRPELELLLSTR